MEKLMTPLMPPPSSLVVTTNGILEFLKILQCQNRSNHYPQKSNKVEFSTADQTSESRFSRTNLRRISYNLLSNPFKYRGPQRSLSITISTKMHTDYVLFKVKDTGQKIQKEHLKKIFKKAERLSQM